MAEQLICNQQVGGSIPFTSSIQSFFALRDTIKYGGIPERPKGADCKSVVSDFGGPNPPSPTRKALLMRCFFLAVFRKQPCRNYLPGNTKHPAASRNIRLHRNSALRTNTAYDTALTFSAYGGIFYCQKSKMRKKRPPFGGRY